MPCTINFGDTVIMERCFRPMPFDPGPAFPIFFFDPIFGRTPGRMDLPPEISPDPEPGMGEMDTIRPLTPLECIAVFANADGAVGAAVQGASAIAAGAPFLPKSLVSDRLGIAGGGRSGKQTSVISALARGFFGQSTTEFGAFGTRSVGGALGRGLSRASVFVGAAFEAKSLFSLAKVISDCNLSQGQ